MIFIIRSAITPLASTANNIKGLNIRCSTCDKGKGQILFRGAHLSGIRFPKKQNAVGTKADSHTWYVRPGVAIPPSASDEKTAPVAAPPLGPF
jgi:hypothetical protein